MVEETGVAHRYGVITPIPAFGSSVYRFKEPDRDDYSKRAVTQVSHQHAGLPYSHARQITGWSCPDDAVKPGRGQTTSMRATSYMPTTSTRTLPASSLLQLLLNSTNELRLRELYELYYRKRFISPGPGEHDINREIGRKLSTHRPHRRVTDGPFLLSSNQTTTRAREMARLLNMEACDSGLGPGQYKYSAHGKDACMRTTSVGGSIGLSCRTSTLKLMYKNSLSKAIAQSYGYNCNQVSQATQNKVAGESAESEEMTAMFSPVSAAADERSMQGTATVVQISAQPNCASKQQHQASSAAVGDMSCVSQSRQQKRCQLLSEITKGSLKHKSTPTKLATRTQISAWTCPHSIPQQWYWTLFDHSSGSMISKPHSMPPIPETSTLDAGKLPSSKNSLLISGLISEDDLQQHSFAIKVANQARSVDRRKKEWELRSAILPLLKTQLPYVPYESSNPVANASVT